MGFGDKRGFERRRDGAIELRLDHQEAAVLLDLFGQVVAMMDPGEQDDTDPLAQLVDVGSDERPADPAVLRLFPDGYTDDDDASADFRRFTERRLREAKIERLTRTCEVLTRVPQARTPQPVAVSPQESQAVLSSLNDLRLVLGVRLGIVADDQDVTAGWAPDDPRMATYAAYQWLTWLQADLLDCLGPEDTR